MRLISCLTAANSGDSSQTSAQSFEPICLLEPAPMASSMTASEGRSQWEEEGREGGRGGRGRTLGGVGVLGAARAVLGEVPAQDVRVLADVAEVGRRAAALEEEQPVEVLEEKRVGLVDRAQQRDARSGELAQEADDVVRRLTVETCRGSTSVRACRVRGEEREEDAPEVGSSRKSRSCGLAASSTPIVTLLRASTSRPCPTSPIMASALSSSSRSWMTSST